MNVPVGRFEQAAESPLGDVNWRPASEFSHGFTPWKKGLHDNEPDQHQTVLIFPDTRHTAKRPGNERGQIRDFDHRWQRYATGLREGAERTWYQNSLMKPDF